MPKGNVVFTEFPTKANLITVDKAGKIHQADVEILHKHTDLLNAIDNLNQALSRSVVFCFLSDEVGKWWRGATHYHNARGHLREFRLKGLNQLLLSTRIFQPWRNRGEKIFRFFAIEISAGHIDLTAPSSP